MATEKTDVVIIGAGAAGGIIAAELAKAGLMPLVHKKNEAFAAFIGAQSLNRPAEYDDSDATANANLAARLPYLFATCRFAHYLKCMVRDKVGSFKERADMQTWLNKWIMNYVVGNPETASEETKAKRPLSAAEVVVEEVEGNPNWQRLWYTQLDKSNTFFRFALYEGDTYLDILEPYIVKVKEATNLLIGIQTPPHHDLKRYRELRRMGVNRVSFCFELFNRELFQKVCPGKHRQYGLDRYLAAVEYCANEVPPAGRSFEPWVTNGEIIAGLEPPEDSIRAIDWITGVGAIPTVCVFRPLAGTDYRDVPPPKTEEMIPVFRRMYDACMERGLPIGIAPNVHVSLVMLPEEGRWLSERPGRFWMGELKRKAMRKVFGYQFARELRKAAARAA
jgi:hypothetical protein